MTRLILFLIKAKHVASPYHFALISSFEVTNPELNVPFGLESHSKDLKKMELNQQFFF